MGILVLAMGLGQPPSTLQLLCCRPQHFKPGVALGSMGCFKGAATEAGTVNADSTRSFWMAHVAVGPSGCLHKKKDGTPLQWVDNGPYPAPLKAPQKLLPHPSGHQGSWGVCEQDRSEAEKETSVARGKEERKA